MLVSLIDTTCIAASVNLVASNFKCTWEPQTVPLLSFHLFTTLMVRHTYGSDDERCKTRLLSLNPTALQLQLLSFPMKPLPSLLHAAVQSFLSLES